MNKGNIKELPIKLEVIEREVKDEDEAEEEQKGESSEESILAELKEINKLYTEGTKQTNQHEDDGRTPDAAGVIASASAKADVKERKGDLGDGEDYEYGEWEDT